MASDALLIQQADFSGYNIGRQNKAPALLAIAEGMTPKGLVSMPPQSTPTWSVYALCDPETLEVRYVGKARNVSGRYGRHLRESEQPKTHKQCWIKSLLSQGMRPALLIVEVCLSEHLSYEREHYWVEYFRKAECRLTNQSDGGFGPVGATLSEEQRAKVAQGVRAYYADPKNRAKRRAEMARPDVKANISRGQRGRKATPETLAKKAESARLSWCNPEHRARRLKGMMSDENRARIVALFAGTVATDEARAKMRASQSRRRAKERAGE